MNKKYYIFIFTFICSTLLFAQSDPKAKVVLDNALKNYKTFTSLNAKFTQTIETPGAKNIVNNGQVYIKGDKYKVVLADQIIFCDQKTVWTYLKDINEVQINDYEPSNDEITPTNIYTIYQTDFFYALGGIENALGTSCQIVDLTPKKKEKPYFKVRIWLDKKTQIVKQFKIFDKNGSRYNYAVTNINTNAGLQDAFFKFNAKDFPGVHIEDLRM
jgi:outer membrane lipoprotein carrier protein